MQHGDVMHGVSLDDEPFHGLCCRTRQGQGVEAGETNRAAMVRIAECLERHHVRCLASLIRELAWRWRRREQERQLGQPVPAGHHKLDEPGIDVNLLVPLQGQHVWAVGRSKKKMVVGTLDSMLVYLIL